MTKHENPIRLLSSLSLPLIADSRVALGLPETHLDTGIKPILPFSKMVGTAVTLRFVAAAEAEDADLSLVGEAYDQPKNSHDLIIVMELPPALHRYGIFGDHAATNAQEHGFVGALIDGAVRDTHALKEMDFPVFARANSPGYIGYKAIAVELGGPVSVGGRTVHHGDVIVADNDGVLVIKPEEADTVVERAVAIQRWEERGRELLRQGKTFDQIDKIVGPRP